MSTKNVAHRFTSFTAVTSLVFLPILLTFVEVYGARHVLSLNPLAVMTIEAVVGFAAALFTWIVWNVPYRTSQRKRDIRCAWGFGLGLLALGGAAATSAFGGLWLCGPLLALIGAVAGQSLSSVCRSASSR